jgi:glycosyltransferase involved in cell wall biosynthesis/SAM-dependent methyltransferase
MTPRQADLNYFARGVEENPRFWARLGGAPPLEGRKVLDIGCGHGSLCVDMAERGAARVVGIDVDQERIRFAAENLRGRHPDVESRIEFIGCDVGDLNEADFDVIVSKDTFEHIVDLAESFPVIARRLRRGGRMYIGFGPLYRSPRGDHGRLRARLPWGHLVVPESLLLRRLRRRGTSVTTVEDLGLNKYRVGDFRSVFDEAGLTVIEWHVNASDRLISRVFSALRRVLPSSDILAHNLYCVLEKPAMEPPRDVGGELEPRGGDGVSRVLVTVPHAERRGGIIAYWHSVRPFLRARATLLTVGKRTETPSPSERASTTVRDTIRLCRTLATTRVDAVQLNAGLDAKSLLREGLHLLVAKSFGRPVVVLFHGWQPAMERRISHRFARPFRAVFGRADATLVLSDDFRTVMRQWGCRGPIHTTTSLIDPACMPAVVELAAGAALTEESPHCRVLFMARLLREKGIHETIDAFHSVALTTPGLTLVIAGDGPERSAAEAHVKQLRLDNVEFLGDVRGDRKVEALLSSHVYVLPTQHAEGMPTTVLEAMAFGLTSIVPRVAGLRDFFVDGEMGLVLESTAVGELETLLRRAVNDHELRDHVGGVACAFALSHFAPAVVAGRLDAAYVDLWCATARVRDRDWRVESQA